MFSFVTFDFVERSRVVLDLFYLPMTADIYHDIFFA
jgi:hypothetical protein